MISVCRVLAAGALLVFFFAPAGAVLAVAMPIARIRLRKAHAVLDKDLICSEIMDPSFRRTDHGRNRGEVTTVLGAKDAAHSMRQC